MDFFGAAAKLCMRCDALYAILNILTYSSDYFQLNDLPARSHPLTIYPLPSSINAFRFSYIVNSVFIWNSVSFDVLSAPSKHFKFKLK